MVKKVFALALGLVLSFGAMAQYSNPVVPQSDIQFWTGTGTNRAVIAITWNDATAGNIGIAWGVQWNGANVSVADLMDTIAAYDTNLTIAHGTNTYTLINNLTYVNAEMGLNLVGPAGWWWYNWTATDGSNKQSEGAAADIMVSGDFVDWLPMDEYTYESYPADTMIMAPDPNAPVDPQPEDATIAVSDILYWVGTGSNEVVLAVNWADTALAWGYRFATESVSVEAAMNDIAAADPRFSFVADNGWLTDIYFVENGDTLSALNPGWWMSTYNGNSNASVGMATELSNNDFFKWGDYAAGITIDTVTYAMVFTATVYPVSVPAEEMPEDAVIAFEDILYWVGEGSNQVVLAVNWADTTLAWGYRFATESVSVEAAMNDIAAADPRFSFVADNGWLTDIYFVENGDTLSALTPGWWMSTYNGNSNASVGMATELSNNDFFKWGDYAAGITIDTVTYAMVFPMTVYPVSAPQTQGIANVDNVNISVYPNPVARMVTISGIEGSSNTAVLYDMRGSLVATFMVNGAETRLDLSHLTSGVYMLRVADSVVKIVKE